MKLTKKLLALILVLCLGCLALTACGIVTQPLPETQEFTTASPDAQYSTNAIIQETIPFSNTEAPATAPVSTMLNLPRGTFQTAELKAFFDKYQPMMQELTKPLIEQNIESADIDSGYSGLLYVDETFSEEVGKKFKSYIAIAEAETKHSAGISVRMIDGKRVISFSFSGMDTGGGITYMPDGYVNVRMLYADPEVGELALKTEVKLADNWYSYYG